MRIDDFEEKWRVFTAVGRAQAISPVYFPNVKSLAKEQVALKFPSDPSAPFPAADNEGESMKGPSFGGWLSSNSLPTAREASFATLTSLDVEVWAQPLAAFTVEVQRLNGEVPTWKKLVEAARLGAITVRVDDPGPHTRFVVEGADADAPGSTPAWAGCRAWVELPSSTMSHEDKWRAWLIAEYEELIFVLDPIVRAGKPTPTDLHPGTKILPRGWTLTIPPQFAPGRTFDTVVLALNLGDQGPLVVSAIDQLERQLVDGTEDAHARARHRGIRRALDDAAALISEHGIEKRVYREPCRIVHRAS